MTAIDPGLVPKRQRLSPEVRRGLILDEAARIVVGEGVSAVNMERLGREAGISKALVYNYFPSRADVLAALLLREYRRFQAEGQAAAKGTPDFAALVRATTRAYLRHVAERGLLIQRLMNEPVVARTLRGVDLHERQLTVSYFASAMAAEYDISRNVAATVAELLMGLTGAAGDYLIRSDADIDTVEDYAVSMILAAVDDVARRAHAPQTAAAAQ